MKVRNWGNGGQDKKRTKGQISDNLINPLGVEQVSLQHRSEIQNFKKRAVEIEARLRKGTTKKSNPVNKVESAVSNIEVQA